jgi:hypothetical protein
MPTASPASRRCQGLLAEPATNVNLRCQRRDTRVGCYVLVITLANLGEHQQPEYRIRHFSAKFERLAQECELAVV